MEWLKVFAVALISAGGAFVAYALSRVRSRWWLVAPCAGLCVILAIAAVRREARLELSPPLSWLVSGRREFVLLGLAIPLVFLSLALRLPAKRERILLAVFTVLATAHFSLLAFVLPPLTRGRLLRLETQLDEDGVCRQSTAYTCGPAAAVTALRSFGVKAEEGQLAVAARTTRVTGTDTGVMCAALREIAGQNGLACEFRRFRRLDDIETGGIVVLPVRHTVMADHFVVLLSADDAEVTIGDPARGLRKMPRPAVEHIWRGVGIVLKKEQVVGR